VALNPASCTAVMWCSEKADGIKLLNKSVRAISITIESI